MDETVAGCHIGGHKSSLEKIHYLWHNVLVRKEETGE